MPNVMNSSVALIGGLACTKRCNDSSETAMSAKEPNPPVNVIRGGLGPYCQMVGATIMGIHLVLIFGDSTTGTEMTSGDRVSVDRLTPYEKGRRKVSNVTI